MMESFRSNVENSLLISFASLIFFLVSSSLKIHAEFYSNEMSSKKATIFANVDANFEAGLRARNDAYIEHFWTDPSDGIDRAYIRMIPLLKRESSYVPPGNPLFYYVNEFAISSDEYFDDGLYVSYVNIHSNLPRYKYKPAVANGSVCSSQEQHQQQQQQCDDDDDEQSKVDHRREKECCKMNVAKEIAVWCQAQFEISNKFAVVIKISPCYQCQQILNTKYLRNQSNILITTDGASQHRTVEDAFVGSMAVLHAKGKVLGCATLWPPNRKYWQAKVDNGKKGLLGQQSDQEFHGTVTFASMRSNVTRILADLQCYDNGMQESSMMCSIHWQLSKECPPTAGHLFDTIDSAAVFDHNNSNNNTNNNNNNNIIGGTFITNGRGGGRENGRKNTTVVANSWTTQSFKFEPSLHSFLILWWRRQITDSGIMMAAHPPSSAGADDSSSSNKASLFDSTCIPIKEKE